MSPEHFTYDHLNHVCSGHCHETLSWANLACQLLDYWMAHKLPSGAFSQPFPNHVVAWYHFGSTCGDGPTANPLYPGCYGIHHMGGGEHSPLVVEVDHWSVGWDGKFGMAERLCTPDEDGWEFFPATLPASGDAV